jgi:anti-sigma factor RsiW
MHGALHFVPAGPASLATTMTDQHLPVATITAYVDDTLDDNARVAADRHLAICADCRAELAEVSDLVVGLPTARRSRRWSVVGGVVAAAGLIGVLFLSPAPTSGPTATTERTSTPSASTLEIVQPAASGTFVTSQNAAIVWRAVEPQATYRVTVTDTTGATRWTTETLDTVAALPASVRLEAGARYFLYVDAQRADGWSLQSGPRSFTTAP